ncbi:MAG: rhodanese-like domain-containing protein [Bacteroidota bacterium]
MRATRDQLERLMIKCGVNEGNRLILYDRKGNVDAARLRWLLEISGKKEVYLLDGGIHSWMREGYPVASERKLTSPGDFAFTKARSTSTQLGWSDVKEVLDDPSYVLLDAITAEEYLGQT